MIASLFFAMKIKYEGFGGSYFLKKMTPNFTDNLALELKKALLWFGSLKNKL